MTYRGKLQAAILDWAGTTVDYGCQAPVIVIRDLLARRGVEISVAEARQSMGLLKKDHLRAILALPRVNAAWEARHGAAPSESDVDALFADFVPQQLACLARHSDLIPGVAPAIARMRARGLKIGTTTGYTRAMLDLLLDTAARQGYRPDASVCPDDVGAGRPLPWMCYRNAIELRVWPLAACVKIGDTPADVEEGLNAGMWTIGIALTGNQVGLTEAELRSLDPADQLDRGARARHDLTAAGAHYVVDSVAECDAALDAIEQRLARAEAP